jgi:hypothetical protein
VSLISQNLMRPRQLHARRAAVSAASRSTGRAGPVAARMPVLQLPWTVALSRTMTEAGAFPSRFVPSPAAFLQTASAGLPVIATTEWVHDPARLHTPIPVDPVPVEPWV